MALLRRRAKRSSSRVVAILGMHRSGTSWLTGALEQLGLELGEVSTSNVHNEKGNRESRRLRQIHESVLSANSGSWRRPTWPNRWSRQQRAQLASYIGEMSAAHRVWGFKDPRALLVLDEWHRQVESLDRVGIYRHPVAVHRSLRARHADFSWDEAIDLWRIYNERLLSEHRDDPFPVIRFDVPADELHARLTTVGKMLELPIADRPAAFFDAALVHNRDTEDEAVPAEVADIWDELEVLCLERTG